MFRIRYSFGNSGGRSNQKIGFQTDEAFSLQALRITTNAEIDIPWGLLGQYWKNVKREQEGDVYIYTLQLPQPINITAGSNGALLYSLSTALGPISNVAMPPIKVEIQQSDKPWQTLESVNSVDPKINPHPDIDFTIYTTNWGEYSYHLDAENLSYDAVNSIAYGFIGFDATGNVKSRDPWGDELGLPTMAMEKQGRPYLKTAIAFGGWINDSERMDTVFSQMIANPTARANFVKNAVVATIQAQASGIDIDYEYPDAAAVTNYLALLRELRDELTKQIGPESRLTITAPARKNKIAVLAATQWQQLANTVDLIKVMTYDYFGAFSDTATADFHSAMKLARQSPYKDSGYCIDDTLQLYAKNGVAKTKLSIGFSNYTRAMIVAQPGNYGGLYQPVLDAPMGEFGQDGGVYSWNAIYNVLNHQPSELDKLGVKQWQFYDSNHPFCKDANMCMMTGQLPDGGWITMNFLDQKTAAQRALQFKTEGYAGVMIWADYEETPDPNNRITQAMSNGLDSKVNQYQITDDKTSTEVAVTSVTRLNHAFWKSDRATAKQDALRQIVKVQSLKEVNYLLEENKSILSKYRNPFMRALSHTAFGKYLKQSKSLTDAEVLASNPTRIITVESLQTKFVHQHTIIKS